MQSSSQSNLVRREWENEKRLAVEEKAFQQLLKNYTIRVEGVELDDKALRAIAKGGS